MVWLCIVFEKRDYDSPVRCVIAVSELVVVSANTLLVDGAKIIFPDEHIIFIYNVDIQTQKISTLLYDWRTTGYKWNEYKNVVINKILP